MFWGNPDATVKFCETPYKENDFIAEYYNTISGFIYVIIGLLYIKQYKELAFSCISLGVGTVLLHCTQKHYAQMLDELSMIVLVYLFLNLLNNAYKKVYVIFLVGLYLYFNKNFQIFLTMFIGLVVILINETKSLSYNKRHYKNLFIVLIIIATICWLIDQLFCNYVSGYYLHAVWHILTGICIYIGFKILI